MALVKSFKDSSGDTYAQGYHRISHIDIYIDEGEVYLTGKTYKNTNHRDKTQDTDKPEQVFNVKAANKTEFTTEINNLLKKIYPYLKENDDRFNEATDAL